MVTSDRSEGRHDVLAGVEWLVYSNGNEIIPQWKPSDYFTAIKDVEELRVLKPGDSLWADAELDPLRGRVCGYERMQLTHVEYNSAKKSIHLAYESPKLSGETEITNENIGRYFRLTNRKGLADLVRTHGRLITNVDPSEQMGSYGSSLKVTEGVAALNGVVTYL